MIAPEGYGIVGISIVIGVVLVAAGMLVASPWRWILVGVALLVVAFTLFFFRDPERTIPVQATEGRVLLAPADGKVVVVREVEFEPLYLKSPARQVSIFLSPLNVHVNRVPTNGVVEYDNYVSGDYLVAWHPKASEQNERSQLGIRHPSGMPVLFKQIAGAVARRVVYHIGVGDTVRAGERFGIVKFGSRMDILVPMSVEITVTEGDRVRGGETIIANLPFTQDGGP
ncbi:MAG: phosphatidylserine decarboxylase family protein [Rhodothermales bacterium]|nr:phosphatidylserine decarboxylase family protein [Rhodothermales bacterium]